jgi:hypothetical protein
MVNGWGPSGEIPSVINLLKNAFKQVEGGELCGRSTDVNVKNMDLVDKKLSRLYFCSAEIGDG